jgi:hypothetical protein
VGANPGISTLLVFLSFTLSVLFVCLGIIGEYLVLLQEIKKRPAAIVASVVGDLRPLDSAYGCWRKLFWTSNNRAREDLRRCLTGV